MKEIHIYNEIYHTKYVKNGKVYAERYYKKERFKRICMSDTKIDLSKTKCPVELECDKEGVPYDSTENILKILRNELAIAGKFGIDELSNDIIVTGPLPWARTNSKYWRSSDLDALHLYVNKYINVSKSKVKAAFSIVALENLCNPIRDFLNSLYNEKIWDGVHRIDTFLHDYAGVESRVDTHYDSWIMKYLLLSAIHRVMTPGCKVDEVVILHGAQGGGKSHLVMALAMNLEWFGESIFSLNRWETAYTVRHSWIIEINSLLYAEKTQHWENVKDFLTRSYDRSNELPRHCIFVGTTDNSNFVSDSADDPQFLPIHVEFSKATKNLYDDESFVIKQLWAEAMTIYVEGGYEKCGKDAIYLTQDQQKQAKDERQKFREKYCIKQDNKGTTRIFNI